MPTVLITGANRGIGLAFARAYAARGWTVHATARDPAGADRLRELAAASGERVAVHAFDLAAPQSAADLARSVGPGPIDVLLSNAALTGGPLGTFGAFDMERFLEACRVNAGGFMGLAQAFADQVAASECKVIFAMSSRIGAQPFYGYAEYFASKSALNQLVMQTSVALRPQGVTVVAAHPGWVETEATAAQGKAPLDAPRAAELLMRVIDGLTIEQTGRFFDPDCSTLPLVTQQHEVKFYSKPRDATR